MPTTRQGAKPGPWEKEIKSISSAFRLAFSIASRIILSATLR